MDNYGVFERLSSIVMETHDGREDELFDRLVQHGYKCYSTYQGGQSKIGMLFGNR